MQPFQGPAFGENIDISVRIIDVLHLLFMNLIVRFFLYYVIFWDGNINLVFGIHAGVGITREWGDVKINSTRGRVLRNPKINSTGGFNSTAGEGSFGIRKSTP